MSTFWWEDEWDPNLKVDHMAKTRIPSDDTGERFLRHRIETSACQLSGLVSVDGEIDAIVLIYV